MASVVDEGMSMGHWWNDSERGENPKYGEKNLSHCHYVHHVSEHAAGL